MLKKLALSAFAIGATLLVFGLVGEVVVRLFVNDLVLFPRYQTGVTYGEYQLRTGRPNSRYTHTSMDGSWEFITNAQGFRDTHDYHHEKPAGRVRILSLGDSHTFGYEARQDHTFSAVLEKWLKQRGVDAEVLNTGMSGFGNAEELAFLENEGFRYSPDYVVVALFGNDFEDNVKAGLYSLDAAGQLQVLSKTHQPGVKLQDLIYGIPGVPWLSEHSALYGWLFNNVWLFFKTRMQHERSVELAVPEGGGPSEPEIALTRALLQRMQASCRSHGAKLIVVDIPSVSEKDLVTPLSSVPASLRADMPRLADVFLDFDTVFGDDLGGVELHVPHGHRHISEFAHLAIARHLGQVILDDRKR